MKKVVAIITIETPSGYNEKPLSNAANGLTVQMQYKEKIIIKKLQRKKKLKSAIAHFVGENVQSALKCWKFTFTASI